MHFKLIGVQRALQIVQQPLLKRLQFLHLLVEDYQMLFEIVLDHGARCACLVKHLDRFHVFLPGHHTHPQADSRRLGRLLQSGLEAVVERLVLFSVAAENIKLVRLEPAGNSACFEQRLLDFTSERPQDPVAEIPSVQCVHRMEPVNIQNNGVHRPVRMFPAHISGILQEIIPVIKPRQVVRFRR